jgi:lipooligosaccharide transport system permease protein
MSVAVQYPRAARISLAGASRYWYRNLIVLRKTWLGMMTWFVEPVIYLVGMGTGLASYVQDLNGSSYVNFIAPGLIAVSAMYGATFEATWGTYNKMSEQRTYDAASATPLTLEDVAIGEALWATTRSVMYGSAFVVVAAPFGVFGSWWALLAIPALAPVGAVFAIMGLIYTYSVRRIDFLAYYWTMFLTPMFMFAGVFFPLDRLPGWLQTLAWFMPLHHAADMMRALTLQGDPARAAGSALWLVVVSAMLIWIPPVLLRRRLAP